MLDEGYNGEGVKCVEGGEKAEVVRVEEGVGVEEGEEIPAKVVFVAVKMP